MIKYIHKTRQNSKSTNLKNKRSLTDNKLEIKQIIGNAKAEAYQLVRN